MAAFSARYGHVYMDDGPWEVRLEPRQCDQLLTIFDEANAVSQFNGLWEAMDAVGLCPSTFGRPKPFLRVVAERSAQDIVRAMLVASLPEDAA